MPAAYNPYYVLYIIKKCLINEKRKADGHLSSLTLCHCIVKKLKEN